MSLDDRKIDFVLTEIKDTQKDRVESKPTIEKDKAKEGRRTVRKF